MERSKPTSDTSYLSSLSQSSFCLRSFAFARAWFFNSDTNTMQPYKPKFDKEVEAIPDWASLAKKYLIDDNTKVGIALLELGDPSNMDAALSVLGDTNKGKSVKLARLHTAQLFKTHMVNEREKTMKSAKDHEYLRFPDPKRFNTPELTFSYNMARLVLYLVQMRQEAHGNEFANVLGQHLRDSGVLIYIIFDLLLDYRDGAHGGDLVNKFLPDLPSYRPNPSPTPPSTTIQLPFAPRFVVLFTSNVNKIKMARKYLEHSQLFSEMCLLDLSSRVVRKAARDLLKLLDSDDDDAIINMIRNLAANAKKYLNAPDHGSDELAQGKSLEARLIRLAAGLVTDMKTEFPMDFADIGTIVSNLRVIFALALEVIVAHDEEGSYFHRKIAAAATAPKRATTLKRTISKTNTKSTNGGAATSKRTISQTNTDSANHKSFNVQPAKKHKKQASNKRNDNVPGPVQESAESDTLEARDKHLEQVESDAESSSLFIPQTLSGSPVVLSPATHAEAFDRDSEDAQTTSFVSSKGNKGPQNPRATTSNSHAPQKQRSSALLKPVPQRTGLQDQAPEQPNRGGILDHRDVGRNTHRKPPSRNSASLTATATEQEQQIKNSSTEAPGRDASPIHGKGKKGRNCRREARK